MTNEYNPNLHHRRSIRLKNYDYAQSGAYFVTICTQNKECLFGNVLDGGMRLNEYGRIVETEWLQTAIIRADVELDEFIVMPNHFHGILVLTNDGGDINDGRGTARRAPTNERFGKPVVGSLPTIIRSFKSAVTKQINQIRGIRRGTARRSPTNELWQRNYYEHIIRNEKGLNEIRKYILNNPLQWTMDENNPLNIKN